MTPFTRLTAIAAPLPQPNIDTDVIMPKQFLKRIDRKGLAEGAFHDLRFTNGQPNPEFILNQPPYVGAEILVCGDNFGCGSSREYAVWGLMQLGIRAIIAPTIAGIFFGNCEMNGLLAITLPENEVATLLDRVANPEDATLTINLPNQTIEIPSLDPITFKIGEARKRNLMTGVDHVGQTLALSDEIKDFESEQRNAQNWLWGQ
ncbi:MAG: 3-isopropylmalate dehydratase small subunit [Rhizobiales bacterium]|nr:3-isopropylmalate dehydratase small subunit [Hyphomicrobiales bacterium]MBO6698543.1 3-isopropylmalate dehydratase small subunit [Hyphomicrobiales bacterium]MBO6735203.1 3-isopropylmalate dehydratase small subunit [Hyphomicrobiales bacterium]MBO6910989.1 3-isopropylmalate dehydratase small subunit [Hyphomicrobiales bacterium]